MSTNLIGCAQRAALLNIAQAKMSSWAAQEEDTSLALTLQRFAEELRAMEDAQITHAIQVGAASGVSEAAVVARCIESSNDQYNAGVELKEWWPGINAYKR